MENVYIIFHVLIVFFLLCVQVTFCPRAIKRLYEEKKFVRMIIYIVLQILLLMMFIWKSIDMFY